MGTERNAEAGPSAAPLGLTLGEALSVLRGGERAPEADGQPVRGAPTARRVLSEPEICSALRAFQDVANRKNLRIRHSYAEEMLDAALARVGVLTPPPEPEDGLCGWRHPDDDGFWHQCSYEPGHDGDSHGAGEPDWHGDGDLDWREVSPEAVAPPTVPDAEARQ